MLEIKLRSKTYPNGYTALKEIDLQFPDKGLFMIVGESGSGKSTLMQCVSGMMEFDGELRYDGKIIESQRLEDYRRDNVGYIFQDYKLFDDLSAIDNVVLGNQIVGRQIDKQIAYDQLKEVGLERMCNKKTKLLSGGEKQRVAIARTVVKKPNIIVADEPTGNLDSKNSRKIMSLLKQVSKSRLVLVVTHNTNLAQDFGDRIIKIADGKVIEVYDNSEIDDGALIKEKPEETDNFSCESKAGYMNVKSFFQLAFLRGKGSKLIATALLTLTVLIIALFATMIAGLNKSNLAERYLSRQEGNFAKTSFIESNGQQAFIAEQDGGSYSYYAQCKGWYINSSNQDGDEEYQIDYCLQLGDENFGLELLYGDYPEKVDELCVPIDLAKLISRDSVEGLVGQKIRLNTGLIFQEFVVKGIFDSYASDGFLSKCVVILGIRDLLQVSTAENYVGSSFICKKGGIDIAIYNADALGQDVAKGEVLLSPSLSALASMISANESAKGIFSFVFSDKLKNVEKKIAGVEASLNSYSAVLNNEDYIEMVKDVDVRYSGTTFDCSKIKVAEVYKYFGTNKEDLICYISGNYMSQEFIDIVMTVEAINIKIMLPIAIVFWLLSVLCAYVMLKNLTMANKKNLLIMRMLGIKKSLYFSLNCIGNVVRLIAVSILAVVICACVNLILSTLDFLISLIFAFVGWEFLGLVIAILTALAFSSLYLNKVFDSKLN